MGGYTHFLLERLGISVGNKDNDNEIELKSLLRNNEPGKKRAKQATLTHRTSRNYP